MGAAGWFSIPTVFSRGYSDQKTSICSDDWWPPISIGFAGRECGYLEEAYWRDPTRYGLSFQQIQWRQFDVCQPHLLGSDDIQTGKSYDDQ